MDQYRKLFGTTRIPGETVDSIETPAFPYSANHIVVLTKGQIYKVDVLRPNGTRVPLQEIERSV
jgi:carnitine O-acetyltransferase